MRKITEYGKLCDEHLAVICTEHMKYGHNYNHNLAKYVESLDHALSFTPSHLCIEHSRVGCLTSELRLGHDLMHVTPKMLKIPSPTYVNSICASEMYGMYACNNTSIIRCMLPSFAIVSAYTEIKDGVTFKKLKQICTDGVETLFAYSEIYGILIMDIELKELKNILSKERQNASFDSVRDMCFKNDKLYVLDGPRHSVHIFTPNGTQAAVLYLSNLLTTERNFLSFEAKGLAPSVLAVGDNFFVLGAHGNILFFYSLDGKHLLEIRPPKDIVGGVMKNICVAHNYVFTQWSHSFNCYTFDAYSKTADVVFERRIEGLDYLTTKIVWIKTKLYVLLGANKCCAVFEKE